MNELKFWIEERGIKCEILDNIVKVIGFGNLVFIQDKDGKIIDDEFRFILSDEEHEQISSEENNYILFRWADKFFYSSKVKKLNEYNEDCYKPEFKYFSNVGEYEESFDLDFIHLGIHTGYELLNGSAEPEAWVDKAYFLKQKTIGVCDKNTLASSLPFQLACKKKGIKSIIGETISVAYNFDPTQEHHDLFDLKLYVKNDIGWKNLLNIGKFINVDYEKFIPEQELLKLSKGLICVISTDSFFNYRINKKTESLEFIEKYKKAFGKNLYYQIDSVEWSDDSLDITHLSNLKKYFDSYSDYIKPVLINDSYYLEKNDYKIKSVLNQVDRKTNYSSEEQHYKTLSETIERFIPRFEENEEKFSFILEAIENTVKISDSCNFVIDVGTVKLPKFEHEDSLALYYELIEKGFQKKVIEKFDDEETIIKYYERIEEENEVIVGAGLQDYFLMLWDIIDWCHKENILVGPGRGSAGGSLVSYLLGIIEIDPIKHDLLFERFLNKTRVMPEKKTEITLEDGRKFLIPEIELKRVIEVGEDLTEDFIKANLSEYKIL